jgi:hypothetical protein
MTPQNEHDLERLVIRAVRGLPMRSAPTTLESRVQAELARRASLPWWRKSYVDWPIAVRALFAVGALGVVKLVLMGAMWAQASVNLAKVKTVLAPELHALEAVGALLRTVFDLVTVMLASIPALWLYGGAATLIALYLTLFGLGAATYRTLSSHSN